MYGRHWVSAVMYQEVREVYQKDAEERERRRCWEEGKLNLKDRQSEQSLHPPLVQGMVAAKPVHHVQGDTVERYFFK